MVFHRSDLLINARRKYKLTIFLNGCHCIPLLEREATHNSIAPRVMLIKMIRFRFCQLSCQHTDVSMELRQGAKLMIPGVPLLKCVNLRFNTKMVTYYKL